MTADKFKDCPFCGSTDIDPEGCASFKPEYKHDTELTWDKDATPDKIQHTPACNNCNATTDGDWNTRAEPASDTPGGEEYPDWMQQLRPEKYGIQPALTPQPSQNAGDAEKDGWDRAAKLKADIFYFREAYKNEWEDFDLQRFDRMEKCVDYLTKGKTND